MSQGIAPLRIAYTVQNIGIDLTSDMGIAITVKYTIRHLQKAGHRVSLLALSKRSIIGIDDVSNLNALWYAPLGITGSRSFMLFESGVRRLQRELNLPYFAFFDSYRFYVAICRTLPRYDICHEHNGLLSIGTALACWRMKVPYILTVDADPIMELSVMGTPLRGLRALVAGWEARLTYKLANRIICISEQGKQNLIKRWGVDPDKIIVVQLAANVELFGKSFDSRAVRARLGLCNAPVVMFVGSFQMWHGIDRLVESFVLVLQKIPEAKLLLVGDGPARPIIEQKIAELGVAAGVVVTGFVPHGQVPEILAVADVVALPYPHLPEKLWFSPLKLYEYMAAGKAIVASRSGQIAEVVEDEHTGLLVEPGNVEELAQIIIRLLKEPAERRRLGQNARQQAIERHSWEHYASRLEETYFSVL